MMVTLHPDIRVCDFCLEPLPRNVASGIIHAKFPVPMMMAGINVTDNGEWFMCEVCAPLIKQKKWEELIARGVERQIARGRLATHRKAEYAGIITGGWSLVFGAHFLAEINNKKLVKLLEGIKHEQRAV